MIKWYVRHNSINSPFDFLFDTAPDDIPSLDINITLLSHLCIWSENPSTKIGLTDETF
jgi:hypothetical protein